MGRPVRSGILSRRRNLQRALGWNMPAPPDTVPAHIVAALGGDPTVPARRIDPADVPAPAPDHPGVSVAPTPRSEPPGADLIDDQVRDLAAAGLGRRRIAAKLGITEHRVRKALAPRADRGK